MIPSSQPQARFSVSGSLASLPLDVTTLSANRAFVCAKELIHVA